MIEELSLSESLLDLDLHLVLELFEHSLLLLSKSLFPCGNDSCNLGLIDLGESIEGVVL